MTEMILAETLKTVRKARKVGRPKLAKLTGMSERQISKLENANAVHPEITTGMLLRISDALQVPSGVLTGEVDVSEEDMQPLCGTSCSSGCCG